MSYLNDPRENAIRVESGVTLESDNRIEQMWHWNAMVVDLCNMSPSDYQQNVYTVVISGSSGSSSEKQINEITTQIIQSDDDIKMVVKSNKYVASNLYVVCDYQVGLEDGSTISGSSNVALLDGSKSGETIIAEGKVMSSVKATVYVGSSIDDAVKQEYEDDEYIYKVSDIENTAIEILYGIYSYTGNTDDLSLSMLTSVSEKEYKDYEIIFTIPIGNGDKAQSQEELDAETYNLILAIPSKFLSSLLIKEYYLNADVTIQFENISKTEILNGVEYTFLVRNGKDEIYTFSSEERKLRYKVTINQ